MITVNDLCYSVGKKILLDDVSVNFKKGSLNIIIGPNGAGKSTLIKAICNQIHPQAGAVYYDGKNVTGFEINELAKTRAVLSQSVELAFPLTVKEVVMMGRYPHFAGRPSEKDHTYCKEAMRLFDVYEMADRNYITLSGGEKQRVYFARVLAQIWHPVENQNRYLLLDEPLTFLDVHYQFDFMHKIVALLKEQDIVVVGVVHDLNLAAKFADHIVLLHDGKVLASGPPAYVLTKEFIKTAYRLDPVIVQNGKGMFLFFE